MSEVRTFSYENELYYPIGAASNVYNKDLINYIISQFKKKEIRIGMGAQPNSSPHFGTILVFSLGFSLAKKIMEVDPSFNVTIVFEVVDTAPCVTKEIDGRRYQYSLRSNEQLDKNMIEYREMLDYFQHLTGVKYIIRTQSEINSHRKIPSIIKEIMNNENILGKYLEPYTKKIKLRIACPKCGLTDKDGHYLEFHGDYLKSYCPENGYFETNINEESHKFEYNTPLRNVVKSLVYMDDNNNEDLPYQWFRIIGSDYAGFYQDQTLYKCVSLLGYPVHELTNILYAPLVLDWSGAKISKSLYLRKNAYKYLPQYLVSYDKLKEQKGIATLSVLNSITDEWINDPKKLFRHYSVYYFIDKIEGENNNG